MTINMVQGRKPLAIRLIQNHSNNYHQAEILEDALNPSADAWRLVKQISRRHRARHQTTGFSQPVANVSSENEGAIAVAPLPMKAWYYRNDIYSQILAIFDRFPQRFWNRRTSVMVYRRLDTYRREIQRFKHLNYKKIMSDGLGYSVGALYLFLDEYSNG